MKYKDIINNSTKKFVDISSESTRTYYFKDYTIIIISPIALNVSDSGGHTLIDDSGICYYIKNDWIYITWSVYDKSPHCVL